MCKKWQGCVESPGHDVIKPSFSHGEFISFKHATEATAPTSTSATEEASEVSVNSGETTAVYSCPQDGCLRVFQRLSALEKHFSLEKCTQSLERHSLMDLAKMGYKTCLEEGVGVLPAIQAPISHQEASLIPKEGWAIRAAKKSYRFSDKQKSYLMAKFHIGQTTGRKVDTEVVAREIRRARGTDGVRLFQASEFLSSSQVASFSSRQSAAVLQSDPDDITDGCSGCS